MKHLSAITAALCLGCATVAPVEIRSEDTSDTLATTTPEDARKYNVQKCLMGIERFRERLLDAVATCDETHLTLLLPTVAKACGKAFTDEEETSDLAVTRALSEFDADVAKALAQCEAR